MQVIAKSLQSEGFETTDCLKEIYINMYIHKPSILPISNILFNFTEY